MVEWLIQTIKHGLTINSHIRLGYLVVKGIIWILLSCTIYSTKYLLYMVLMEQSFQLTTDNNFHGLCDVVDE
jgi:hypothetical protein